MVLDGAADPGFADEFDQAHALEGADVVGDGAERRVEPTSELDRARDALIQQRKDPHAQRMAHRLHVTRIVDARDRSHTPPLPAASLRARGEREP